LIAISLAGTISGKSLKIVATKCHIFNLKCTKFDFGWGSAPRSRWGTGFLAAGFKGVYSQGEEGEAKEGERKGLTGE